MSFPIFLGIAALIFIAGVLMIVKGISSDEHEAVPISSPKEIEELKSAFLPPEERGVSKSSLNDDQAKGLTAARHPSGRSFLRTKGQVRIEQLEEENRRLRSDIEQQKDKYNQLEANMDGLKAEYHQAQTGESERTGHLQEQLAKLRLEKEQMAINMGLVEELKKKSELFEKQINENLQQLAQFQNNIQQMENERASLLKERESSVAKSEYESLERRLEGSIRAIETLKSEGRDLQNAYAQLKEEHSTTEEYNRQLLEKEKLLQFELSKNRAQNVGLEKICEDFKQQIESMS